MARKKKEKVEEVIVEDFEEVEEEDFEEVEEEDFEEVEEEDFEEVEVEPLIPIAQVANRLGMNPSDLRVYMKRLGTNKLTRSIVHEIEDLIDS